MTAALLIGSLVGMGVALVLLPLLPSHPHLATALDRLAHESTSAAEEATPTGLIEQVGVRLQRLAARAAWEPPRRDLAILQQSVAYFWGAKAAFAFLAFCVSVLLAVVVTTSSLLLQSAFTVPPVAFVVFTLLATVGASFVPEYNVRDDAASARIEFLRALGSYIDLVALMRRTSAGPDEALTESALIGRSWVFVRLQETIRQSSLAGRPAWDALADLGLELGLPALADLGETMRTAGEENAAVYAQLRSRGAALRNELLEADRERANSASEVLTAPGALLMLVFALLMVTPSLLRMIGQF